MTFIRRLVCSLALLCSAGSSARAAAEPRYVIFSIMGPEAMGSSVGSKTADWDASLQNSVAELRDEFGAQKPGRQRYVGFSVALVPTLNLTPAQLKAQIELALDLAERDGVPVFFHLDDQHFWWRSPELSGNPDMIEWSDFPKAGESRGPAVARYWLPWGDPPSVYPAAPPCLACPAFRDAMAERLKSCVAAPIARRLKIWNEKGQGYLFAGIASGNETQVVDLRASARVEWPVGPVGLDRSQEPPRRTAMAPEEMLPTGYHALHALGYDQAAVERLAGERGSSVEETVEALLADVAHDYAEFQAKTLFESGIPADRLYTHFTSSARSTRAESRAVPIARVERVREICRRRSRRPSIATAVPGSRSPAAAWTSTNSSPSWRRPERPTRARPGPPSRATRPRRSRASRRTRRNTRSTSAVSSATEPKW